MAILTTAQYEFLEKLMPTDWFSAALVVIFIIILEYKKVGNPWTRALMGILGALSIKGFLIYFRWWPF